MLLNDEVHMLKQVPLFAEVASSKLKLLAFASERVAYRAGDVLFHQNDDGDAAFVILKGKADVLVDSPTGQIRVAGLAEHSIVGELGVLRDGGRTATVKAVTPVEALRISKETFLKLLTDVPELALAMVRMLADRLTDTTADLTAARSQNSTGLQ